MNEQTLTQEFERAVHDEPPLGFDPDQVVTRAGQRWHRRQASILAGGGVAAVAILAAVAAPLVRGSGGGEQVQTAGSTTAQAPADGKALWPPAGVTPAHPTDAQLDALKISFSSNLESVLPKVVPGASGLRITSYGGQFRTAMGTEKTRTRGASAKTHVGPTDKGYTVEVAALVPEAPVQRFAPEQLCAAAKQQINTTVTCHYDTATDGGVLMTMDWQWQATDRPDTFRHRISVTNYRPDGSFVEATSSSDPGTDVQPPLGVDQVTKLATDSGFTLS